MTNLSELRGALRHGAALEAMAAVVGPTHLLDRKSVV